MKKIFIGLMLIFSLNILSSIELSLKESSVVNNDEVRLIDVVNEKIPENIGNILLTKNKKFPIKIKNDNVMKILFENNFTNIILSGKETIVYKNISLNEDTSTDIQETNLNSPLTFLENYLSKYIDKNNFKIKVTLVKIEPFIDLDKVNENYKWEINKLKFGLKDISNLKKIDLTIGDKKYNTTINVNINSNIWFSKQSFLKDDYFKKDSFYSKNVDITVFNDLEYLIFDINKALDTKFINSIGTGEALRWNVLKKIPLVIKDQNLKIVINKNNLKIEVNCISLSDSFENEKIKVKLQNGREKMGTLRRNNGECYVELL
jgi:flagella basal body P-ring formation protein FlgA